MRWRLWLAAVLLVLLGLAQPVQAAITVGNNVTRAGSGTTSAISTLGASLLVAIVCGDGTPGISDSALNTWTPLTELTLGGSTKSRVFYVANPTTSATHTFTSGGGVTFAGFGVVAVNGVAPTTPLDQSASATASASTIQAGSITPGSNDQIVFMAVGNRSGTTFSSIDESYSTVFQLNTGGPNYGVALYYKIQTTATATNPTVTMSASSALGAEIASFEPGAPAVSAFPALFFAP